jgi:hypothetical protein
MTRKAALFLMVALQGLQCLSQNKVAYNSDFIFNEGVYLSFQDFKNNNPVPLTHILSDFDIRSADYLQQSLASDTLVYYDNLFEERSVSTLQIWGFTRNNKVHIGFNTVERADHWSDRSWFPLFSIGRYSYFTALTIVTRFIPPTPGVAMQSRGTILDDGTMFPDDGTYYDESVPVQMLLDFKTGNLIQLATGDLNSVSPKLLEDLLADDQGLIAEFTDQSRRDQKQTSMFYIRKFNERNPIYFPVNK